MPSAVPQSVVAQLTRAVTGTLFFVPSAMFLEDVGEAAASSADPSADG